MSRPERFDSDALLLAFTVGELSPEQERALFEAAATDQDLFDQLMEAERVRHALSFPEERRRAAAVLRAWDEAAIDRETAGMPVPLVQPAARRVVRAPVRATPHASGSWSGLVHSAVSTVTTTLLLRLSYALIAAIGSSLVFQPALPGVLGQGVPPVPSVLHLVHAAIAGLLLAIQFTPFLKPQAIGAQDHPIARKCLAQFIAGWRWAWASWLALYLWLWLHEGTAPAPM